MNAPQRNELLVFYDGFYDSFLCKLFRSLISFTHRQTNGNNNAVRSHFITLDHAQLVLCNLFRFSSIRTNT